MTLDPRVIGDLDGLADAVICADLDSFQFPEFLAGFQDFTGCVPGPHICEIASAVREGRARGLCRTPAEIAEMLRDKARELKRIV